MYDLSIVIPTYNERKNIISLLEEIQRHLLDIHYQIIIVDDNSPDQTSTIIREYCRTKQDSRIISTKRIWRKGLSSAVVEGISIASGELIVVMDGDKQHDPRDILKMLLLQSSSNLDLVIGSRFKDSSFTEGLSSKRNFLSKVAIKFTHLFIDSKISDPMTGFFLVKRDSISPLLKRIYKDGFKILFDLLMLKRNINYDEVQISFRERTQGHSKLNIATYAHLLGQIIENLTRGFIPGTLIVFSSIGSIGVIVHFSVLYLLLSMDMSYLFSNFFGSLVALASNYTLNNLLTFNNIHNTYSKRFIGFVKYSLFNSFSLIANTGITSMLYYDNFSIAISSLVGILAGLILNYFLAKDFVFRS